MVHGDRLLAGLAAAAATTAVAHAVTAMLAYHDRRSREQLLERAATL